MISEEIGGLPVRRICQGAFSGTEFSELVFPSSLRCVEEGAFRNCQLGTIFLFDSLTDVSDRSFDGCGGLRTLYVNAALSPVYSGSYYDTFSDKYDWLLSIRDQKKIMLASGSSGRYGYDSNAIHHAFPDYQTANMGVYAYSNALPQLEILRTLMLPGDILLSAPEFDAIAEQFCTTNALDAHFWAKMESNYDMLSASTASARSELHRYLCEELCVPVISEMEDYLLSGIYFWQIDSHTSTEGAAIRTRQVIEDLLAQGVGTG